MEKEKTTFAQERKDILELKKAHNVNSLSVVKWYEMLTLTLIVFGMIPVIGLIGSLNTEFNYVFYSVNIGVLILYFLLRQIQEERIKKEYRLDYNSMIPVWDDLVSFVIGLSFGSLAIVTMALYGPGMFDGSLWGIGLLVLIVFIVSGLGIAMLFKLIVSGVSFKVIRKLFFKGCFIIVMHMLLYALTFSKNISSFKPLYFVFEYTLIFVLFYLKDFMNTFELNYRLRFLYSAIFLLMIIVISFKDGIVNETEEIIISNQVAEMNVPGLVGLLFDEAYVYANQKTLGGNKISVFDHDFNLLYTTELIPGISIMYVNDDGLHLQTQALIEQTNHLQYYDVNQDEVILTYDFILSNFSKASSPFKVSGTNKSYIAVTDEEEIRTYRIEENNLILEEMSETGVLYQDDFMYVTYDVDDEMFGVYQEMVPALSFGKRFEEEGYYNQELITEDQITIRYDFMDYQDNQFVKNLCVDIGGGRCERIDNGYYLILGDTADDIFSFSNGKVYEWYPENESVDFIVSPNEAYLVIVFLTLFVFSGLVPSKEFTPLMGGIYHE